MKICRKKRVWSLMVFCLLTAFYAVEAGAQSSLPPPISPWISMFNYNRGGALSNYHTFVVPQQRAAQEFQAQERQIQAQGARQQQLQGEVDKVLNQPRKTINFGSRQPSGYGQYMHYYQNGVMRSPVPNFTPAATGRRRY